MLEKIDERIGVVVVYNPRSVVPLPRWLKWGERTYRITKVDFCHPAWEGKTLHHIYSINGEGTYFKLDFNTRSQQWWLKEIADGSIA